MTSEQLPPRPQRAGDGCVPSRDSVVDRLERLRALYVPESDADARVRLTRERPPSNDTFAAAVERRLRDLRALCDLAAYLHRGTRPGARGDSGG